jgi:hypothetical protein
MAEELRMSQRVVAAGVLKTMSIMDELQSNLEWKEAARWLKFEEDVEGGGRWSKPHVATLSLHSLFELRSCLLNGATLLDFAGEDLPTIVGKFCL